MNTITVTEIQTAPETNYIAVKLDDGVGTHLVTVRWEYETRRYIVQTESVFLTRSEAEVIVRGWPRDEGFTIIDVTTI